MSESGKRFGELGSEFGHDFETLSERLVFAYGQLHDLAHADESPHADQEELRMELDLDGEVREVYCAIDEYEWMRVRVQDSQGDQAHIYRSSLKTERKQTGGKHRAGGRPLSPDASKKDHLSQIDTMIAMAGILETCFDKLTSSDDAVIEIYEK